MAFNCSVLLSDIGLNCSDGITGGIKKVYLGLKENLTLTLDTSAETVLLSANLGDAVTFEHNPKDKSTYFLETKETDLSVPVIETEIFVKLPAIDNKASKIEEMSYRNDIVCILMHNNGSATISGRIMGLDMNYSAASGTSTKDISSINITLKGSSWESSIATSDQSLISLGTPWATTNQIWSNNNIIWG
tara:strand:- start:670 stop:1239 length:570 start_codon:yes stop_codon:yes gene_type:complete